MEVAGFTVISKANGKPAGQPSSKIIDLTKGKTPRKEMAGSPDSSTSFTAIFSIAFAFLFCVF